MHIRTAVTITTPIKPDYSSGVLSLRRGTLSIIGTTLNFTEGTIDFNGAGLSNPALKFVAQSVTSTLVATHSQLVLGVSPPGLVHMFASHADFVRYPTQLLICEHIKYNSAVV